MIRSHYLLFQVIMAQKAGSCQYCLVSFAEIDLVKSKVRFSRQIDKPQSSAFQNIHFEILNLWLSEFPLGKTSSD